MAQDARIQKNEKAEVTYKNRDVSVTPEEHLKSTSREQRSTETKNTHSHTTQRLVSEPPNTLRETHQTKKTSNDNGFAVFSAAMSSPATRRRLKMVSGPSSEDVQSAPHTSRPKTKASGFALYARSYSLDTLIDTDMEAPVSVLGHSSSRVIQTLGESKMRASSCGDMDKIGKGQSVTGSLSENHEHVRHIQRRWTLFGRKTFAKSPAAIDSKAKSMRVKTKSTDALQISFANDGLKPRKSLIRRLFKPRPREGIVISQA